MKIFVFGSSITSSYWNGAATYYRGIYKYLHKLGYDITFAEPDIYRRQQNRDARELPLAPPLEEGLYTLEELEPVRKGIAVLPATLGESSAALNHGCSQEV